MMNIKPPLFKFCPFCASKLQVRTEERKQREYCRFCDWTYYPHVFASTAAIIFKKKKVLLVKRKREPYANTWMFPAGFIEYGEHPEEALVRETEEETGLKIKPVKVFHIFQSEDDPRAMGHFIFFYLTKITGGRVKMADENENSKIGWFPLKDLPGIGWKAHKEVVRMLKNSF